MKTAVPPVKPDCLSLPELDYVFLFEKFGPSLGFWRAAEIAALREAAPYEPPILDLGCGDGLVTSRIFPRVAVGLDPDAAALEHAAELGVYGRLIAQPMEKAGLQPGSMGTVISNSVLEHISAIDSVLQAAARVLKPGGRLVFTVPTEAFSRWLALPGSGYAARRNAHFQHLNLWPAAQWAEHLSAAGLKLDCVRPYLGRGWVRTWDALELLQMIYLGAGRRRVRLFGQVWRRLPAAWVRALAHRASRLDLSAPAPGGGRLISAAKRVNSVQKE